MKINNQQSKTQIQAKTTQYKSNQSLLSKRNNLKKQGNKNTMETLQNSSQKHSIQQVNNQIGKRQADNRQEENNRTSALEDQNKTNIKNIQIEATKAQSPPSPPQTVQQNQSKDQQNKKQEKEPQKRIQKQLSEVSLIMQSNKLQTEENKEQPIKQPKNLKTNHNKGLKLKELQNDQMSIMNSFQYYTPKNNFQQLQEQRILNIKNHFIQNIKQLKNELKNISTEFSEQQVQQETSKKLQKRISLRIQNLNRLNQNYGNFPQSTKNRTNNNIKFFSDIQNQSNKILHAKAQSKPQKILMKSAIKRAVINISNQAIEDQQQGSIIDSFPVNLSFSQDKVKVNRKSSLAIQQRTKSSMQGYKMMNHSKSQSIFQGSFSNKQFASKGYKQRKTEVQEENNLNIKCSQAFKRHKRKLKKIKLLESIEKAYGKYKHKSKEISKELSQNNPIMQNLKESFQKCNYQTYRHINLQKNNNSSSEDFSSNLVINELNESINKSYQKDRFQSFSTLEENQFWSPQNNEILSSVKSKIYNKNDNGKDSKIQSERQNNELNITYPDIKDFDTKDQIISQSKSNIKFKDILSFKMHKQQLSEVQKIEHEVLKEAGSVGKLSEQFLLDKNLLTMEAQLQKFPIHKPKNNWMHRSQNYSINFS